MRDLTPHLIPHFIQDKYKENIYDGVISAATMFIDINGFTNMTEKLMYRGREGAEVLSDILNNMFIPVIKAVYDRGGFVSRFAGDALTVIFHKTDPINSIYAAVAIRKIFKEYGFQKTRFGEFELSIKIGLSYGEIKWGIIGEERNKIYFFRGKAIDGCAYSEHLCNRMEIIIDEKIYHLLFDKIDIIMIKEKYYKLNRVKKKENPIKSVIIPNISKDVVLNFLPEKIVKYKGKGEFRNIVSVFISFEEKAFTFKLNKFIENILNKVKDFGGYFNCLDFGDKGSNILIYFGAPVSYEDNIKRALNFIYSLKSEYKNKLRAGLTFGSVYSGIVGSKIRCTYACLGDIVNLSAKFMMKADFGSIWITEIIANKIRNHFDVKYLGEKDIKGKSESVKVYELLGKKHILHEGFYSGEMIGRQSELDSLKEYIKPLYEGDFGGIVYIYGDAGIGKSRLIYEFIDKLDFESYILQTDSILKKSMNPFIYVLNTYFKQDIVKTKEEKKNNFEKIYNDLLNNLQNISDIRKKPIIYELKRAKSILGSLLGLKWEHSLYETLDPKGRYENILLVIKEFFKALSLFKPLILILEDFHHLDLDSYNIFENLTRGIDEYPIIIFITSRFKDDGSKPVLKIDNKVNEKEIILNNLNLSFIKRIIKSELGKPANKELVSLILNKTQGNPFYIEQFLLYLKENNLIGITTKNKNSIYKLINTDIKIPIGISAIIIARIDRLSRELKDIVKIASVIGREFELKILLNLINLYLSILMKKENFNLLIEKGENENIWRSLSEIKYIFKHTLLYETVYDIQLRQNLRALHRLAGETIENLYKDEEVYYTALAHHYERAEQVDKAIEYLEKAGDYAKANYDNMEALTNYNKLLNLTEDKSKKIKVNSKKGEILELIGKWKEAEEIYNLNIEMSVNIQNKLLLANNKKHLGRILMEKGDYEISFTLLDESEKLYSELDNKRGIASVNGINGQIYIDKGDYKKGMEKFQKKLLLCRELNDEKEIADVIGDIGLIYKRQGNYDLAMEYYEKKLKICEKFNNKKEIAVTINNMGIIYSKRGNNNKGMEYYKRGLKIYKELGNKHGISIANNNIGVLFADKRDFKNAMVCYQRKLKICEELGDKDGIGIALGNIGSIYNSLSNYNKAMEYYKMKLDICEKLGDKRGINKANGNIGNIYKSLGKYKEAMDCFTKKLKICESINDIYGVSISKAHIAGIYVVREEVEKALEYYSESISIGRKLGIKYYLCNNLFKKANILFKLNKIDKAEKLNNEAIDVAKKAEREEVVFKGKVLKTKIIGLKDKSKAIEIFENLLKKTKETTEIAIINYELFKLSFKEKYRNKAIKLYKELYQKSKVISYKNNIEELKAIQI